MDILDPSLLEDILLRLDPKSLVMMRCTNKSMELISKDLSFKSRYWSQMRSSLLHISQYGCNLVCFHLVGDNGQPFIREVPSICFILGYCSGLLLFFVDGRFGVANPLTRKYRFVEYYCMPETERSIGFAVDQIDNITQRFKIVCITESNASNPDQTTYGFTIYARYSSRVSKTKITCLSSNLRTDMKPVYFQGCLYWLRRDGNMVTFNPETEEARLIPTKFDQQVGAKLFLGADVNSLTLISATEEMVYVYALRNIFTADPKWILTRRIRNQPVQEMMLSYWNVVAFDGRQILVRANNKIEDVIYGYDLRENMWEVVGLVPGWCHAALDFYQFKPWWSSVNGLPNPNNVPARFSFTMCSSRREASVEGIMELINAHFRI